MSEPFFGRKPELEMLNQYFKMNTSSLITVIGRRRVGKSRLIKEFSKKHNFINLSGLAPDAGITANTQREEFARQLSVHFQLPPLKSDNWGDLFDTLAEQTANKQYIVLLDEISWMGMGDASFLSKLKNVWDKMETNPKIMLIICGSVSSWIDENILSSTGFVGRVTYVLYLKELLLPEANQFWKAQPGNISAHEKFKLLAIMGGIPLYLKNINFSQSAEENIRRLCFEKGGLLFREFKNIFSDLFNNRSSTYEKILKSLVKGPLESEAIANAIGLTYTGQFSSYLDDLTQAGFLTRDYTWNLSTQSDSKFSQYRLSDNYSRFYLKYIETVSSKISRQTYDFISLASLSNWETIMGLQFENLVLNNRNLIKEALHIKLGETISDNPFYQRPTKKIPGCQIDYLIQTRFNTLYLCEIKFSKNKVGMKVIHECEEKIKNLVIPKHTSVRTVLIHVNGVSQDIIDARYFSEIICFSEFLDS